MGKETLPPYHALMNPLLQALKALGGSGTIDEVNERVSTILVLPPEQLDIPHNPERGGYTEIDYRLAWARTFLKKYGVLENSSRGVWALTPKGAQLEVINEKEVVSFVRKQAKDVAAEAGDDEPDDEEVVTTWRDELQETLLTMDPTAFERLIQRMLRESGFVQVNVTGKTGDGGLDGNGIMRLGGVLSFHM